MKYFIQFLTYLRIILGPIIFILITAFHSYGLSLALFVVASTSDFWDGYLARKYNLESSLGAILDPVADKILILFILLALALNQDSLFIGFVGAIMLARDFWVGALRDFNSRTGNINATQVTFLAKAKTTIQFTTFSCYLIALYADFALLLFLADFFLFLALIITLKTGLSYTMATFRK